MNESEFHDRWFSEWGQISHRALAVYADGTPPERDLRSLLELDEALLNDFARDLLQLPPEGPVAGMLREIQHGVHAYHQFQDLLEVLLDGSSPMEGRHYPYYESIVYLREGLTALLLGRHLAAISLGRPFLELAVTHLYWRMKGESIGFAEYYEWFEGDRRNRPFRNMLEWTVDNLPTAERVGGPRLARLRTALPEMYKKICAYHHAPRPKESMVTLGGGLSEPNVYPFMLAMTQWNILIREVVHLYVLAYPMSLFPVAIHERCGFAPPVGIFCDETASAVICRFLSPNAQVTLKEQLRGSDLVQERLAWFDDRPKLSEAQMEESWQRHRANVRMKDDVTSLSERLTRYKSWSRATGWMVNYLASPELNEEISDEAVDEAMRVLKDWANE